MSHPGAALAAMIAPSLSGRKSAKNPWISGGHSWKARDFVGFCGKILAAAPHSNVK
jgi:hypothetical protein